MRYLKRLLRMIYPIGYVLVIVSINPLQLRNVIVGMTIMLPHILYIFLEELSR